MISSKLPKNKNILRRFLDLYGDKEEKIKTSNDKKIIAKEVSKEVASELRDVWLLHFGSYVVYGKENMEQVEENESIKMVIRQDNIEAKILKLYQDYKKLESESKVKGKCETVGFKKREGVFEELLDTPLDISKKNAADKLKDSPTMDWKEDWQNLMKRDLKLLRIFSMR